MSYIAPAGTPISLLDLVLGLGKGVLSNQPARELAAGLQQHSGHPHAWLMSSGRAAMTVIVNAMRDVGESEDKDEIIVPAYTCYSVPAAIERAGLKVRLCDIDPNTLSYDMAQLRAADFSRVLGIVTANLYGLPNDLTAIESLAKERDVFMLDDAAQALGASIDGRPVGGFGDVGLYSFDKGKNIATMQGGAIVARGGALADAIGRRFKALPRASLKETSVLSAKLAAYAILLRPWAYEVVHRLPLGLGQTPYETECSTTQYSQTLAGVAYRLFKRLDALTAARRENATAWLEALGSSPALSPIAVSSASMPAYVRFPARVHNSASRAEWIAAFDRLGIGATSSYPHALCDVPEARSVIVNDGASATNAFVGARKVAATILTLPTHPYCPSYLPQRAMLRMNREALD
jgi:perosamine synthetase